MTAPTIRLRTADERQAIERLRRSSRPKTICPAPPSPGSELTRSRGALWKPCGPPSGDRLATKRALPNLHWFIGR